MGLEVFGIAIIVFALLFVALFFYFVPLGLWITALFSGVHVGIGTLIGMRLRKVNPAAIRPGQRLKLHLKVPKAKPKALGPRFHTVRTGETYASIAAKTGHSLTRLQQLNPKLKATALRPGARLRLRK